MKQHIYYPLLFLFSLLTIAAKAQYKGGAGDGNAIAIASNQSLGRNIFLGGINDGFTMSQAGNQPLGRNFFLGGVNDGTTVSIASNQPLGMNIFQGGVNDGWTMVQSTNQPLGRNIFLGGTNDGVAVSVASNQPLGLNINLGGLNDGWAMAMGRLAEQSPLPIVLIGFTGRWQDVNGLLQWQTSSEINSSYFELERSFDGSNFTSITKMAAAGQSNSPRSYQYSDANIKNLLPTGITTVYYRLRSVDVDSKSEYSGVVVLRTERSGLIQYSLYPNPAKDYVTISTTDVQIPANTLILLADATGRLLLQEKMTNRQQQINVSALPAGTYFLQLAASGKTIYSQKIIIHK